MIRITTIFLCVLLAAAAFGRYRAEVSVRELREDIQQTETSQVEELRSIQMLRAEIAYLENPDRLAKVAGTKTDLRPSDSAQLVNAREFAALLGDADYVAEEDAPAPESDVILHALAMAQLTDAQ
ncbi:cell division protein FtsL [Hyphococcus sp.]|uniref:cell division protein FtsL n=1 Tax=Hyphococcus sp. TaxID=2038636 RepID=UPI0035C74B71